MEAKKDTLPAMLRQEVEARKRAEEERQERRISMDSVKGDDSDSEGELQIDMSSQEGKSRMDYFMLHLIVCTVSSKAQHFATSEKKKT